MSRNNRTTSSALVAAVGTYHPPYTINQEQYATLLFESLCNESEELKQDQQIAESLRSLIASCGVNNRYLALDPQIYMRKALSKTNGELGMNITNTLMRQITVQMSVDAARAALKQANLSPEDITGIVCNVSSHSIPHPAFDIATILGCGEETEFVNTTSGGCVFGMQGLGKAYDYLASHPDGSALFITSEIHSGFWTGGMQQVIAEAAKRKFDGFKGHFKGQLISAILFGDLATAIVLVGSESPLRRQYTKMAPSIVDHKSVFVKDTRSLCGWDAMDNGYMQYLSPKLVYCAPEACCKAVELVLQRNNIDRSSIKHWVLHPGGPAIVKALVKTFDLCEEDISLSSEVYREIGNVASCTAVEILRRTLEAKASTAQEGDWMIGLGVGYGVTACAVLFQWAKGGVHAFHGMMTPPENEPLAA